MLNDELIKEYKKTLEILYKQKEIITKNLEDQKDSSNVNSFIEQIIKIDTNIKEYIIKIKDIEKENDNEIIKDISQKKNIENNNDSFKYENRDKISSNKSQIKEKNLKEKTNNKNLEIEIEKNIIDEIIKKQGKTKIKITLPKKNFETIYTFKNKSHNYYFYHCKNRPKCNGLAKFSLKDNKFYVTKICSLSSLHNNISYNEFVNLFDLKKLSLIDFNLKKMQKYLITKIFEDNKNYNSINVKSEYIKYTKIDLKLNSNEISQIKSTVIGKYRGLTLTACIDKLKEENENIEISSQDIKYYYKTKNNNIESRDEKIIVIGLKKNLNIMKNKEYDDYFLDITFKVIPKKFRPNKLLTIATVDKINNTTLIIAFIVFKYMDTESYYRIFKYLNENYSFSPKYIHTDYESALEKAIKKSEFFDKNILQIKCFFHFIKSLREKLKKIASNKKGLNAESANILNNLELISFINYDKVNDYKKFIIDTLKKKNKYKEFLKYLKNHWFKRNINDYNYSKFINKFKNNEGAINKLYFTNNIV